MPRNEPTPEKEALIQSYVEGLLTPEESVRLRELVRDDPALARAIVENVRMDGAIREVVGERVLEAVLVRRRPRITKRAHRQGMGPFLGILAAACLLLVIGLAIHGSRRTTPRPAAPDGNLGALVVPREEAPRPPEPKPGAPSEERPKPPVEKPAVNPERTPEPRPESPKPEAPKPDVPRPELPKPEPPKPPPTELRPAVALVDGDALIDGRKIAGPVHLLVGQRLETAAGPAQLSFLDKLDKLDKTRVDVAPQTLLREVKLDGGKTVLLDRGEIKAVVTRQPPDKPMVFLTPHGTATVKGTTLRIIVDEKATKLEVIEGRVELKNLAGKAALVESGQTAVAAADVAPVPKSSLKVLLEREGATVSINFGPEDVTPPVGWLKDWGQDFDPERGFGWKGPTSVPGAPGAVKGRWRIPGVWDQSKVKTDPLRASFIYGGSATETVEWAIAVPNGRYRVLVSVGTFTKDQAPHYVRIRDQPLVNKEKTRAGEFKERDDTFTVDKGELRMQIGGHQSPKTGNDKSDDTVINYIVIKRLKD